MLESTGQKAKKPRKFINGNLMQFTDLVVKVIGVISSCAAFRDNSGHCNSRCYLQSVLNLYSYPLYLTSRENEVGYNASRL